MRTKFITAALITQILFCQFVFAQQRGVRVEKTNANGSKQEVQLYDGSYALVIGNSEYSFGWERLSGVKTDVVAVRNVLERHGFKVETEENLTSEQFERRIKKFIDDYGYDRNNRLIIYYAGHGYTLPSAGDKRELGYIIPSDTPLPTKDERGFRQKAVSMYAIQTFAKEIQAKHALFVFDSCFSGKLFALRNSLKITPFIYDKVDNPVRQFITAGDETQTVPDESIFRKALVRGLEGDADRNNDGYIVVTELADYLKEAVTNYSNRRQTPQYGTINDIDLDRGDVVFIVPGKYALTPAEIAWNNFRGLAKSLMKYDEISPYSEGLASAKLNNKYGFIDKTGREIIPPKYDSVGSFSEGLAWVRIYELEKSKYGFIDKTGREIIPINYDYADSFSEGLSAVRVGDSKTGKCRFIDKTGREIITTSYTRVSSFSEGLARVGTGSSFRGKYGFIDKTGQEVIPLKYNLASSLSEGLARVGTGNILAGKRGFIDKTGQEVIPLKYDSADSFSEGLAAVGIGELQTRKYGFIDKAGREVIPLKYDSATSFSEGLAMVAFGNIIITDKSETIDKRKWGIINKTGREVIPIKYDNVWCLAFKKEGFIGVTLNGKKGFIDIYGNEYFDF